MYKVYPYKGDSRSAGMLATSLDGRVLRLVGSRYRPRGHDFIINWGASVVPDFLPGTTLNPDVTAAQNKLLSFQAFQQNQIDSPEFWTNPEDIADDKFPVVCRTILRGHSGIGIVIADLRADLVAAPLYTRYVKKQEEYRVHVIRDRVIFRQRKGKRHDAEVVDWKIRNLAGGFNFVSTDYDRCDDLAVSACKALGLDFGAVDIIYNNKQDKHYVLEVNSAPGLEERTANAYAEGFKSLDA